MPVSPQDFELYSRMTGTPLPSDAMSRMQMAPEVFQFTKNFAKRPNIVEKTGNLIKSQRSPRESQVFVYEILCVRVSGKGAEAGVPWDN